MALFAVLIHAEDSQHSRTATPEELRECDAHFESLVATGRMTLAYALTPRDEALTLRSDGATAGPYRSDGHVIAGFYLLEAEDIRAAAELARRDPSLLEGGGVEIRPVHSGGVLTGSGAEAAG